MTARRRPRLLIALTLALAVVPAAAGQTAAQAPSMAPECGPDSPDGNFPDWPVPGQAISTDAILPLVISSQLVAGPPSRFLYSIADPANPFVPTASADVQTQVSFYALERDPATAVATVPGTFLDSGSGLGLYHLTTTFDCVGPWGLELTATLPSGPMITRGIFDVGPASTVPAIGSPAPRSQTPTGTTPEEIALISTDTAPDPDFYRLSIDQAVGSGRPTWIVFSTPAFCSTATCGPTLDVVKSVAAEYKDRVDFIHVEPYQLQQTEAGLQPLLSDQGQLQLVQSVIDYGLDTEPYQFLVDGAGLVRASFQGIASPDEIRAALDSVLASGG
ncbi:MAG: hypothetical protein ABWZ82_04225 [Candidatus Limnocylindrales bacterium]